MSVVIVAYETDPAGSVHLLGRRSSLADCVALQRSARKPFVRIVPLKRGFLCFELREAK